MITSKQSRPHKQKHSHVTRIMNALLLRDARIRQMIDRELARERPSPLRLMRMKRLALALRQRLDGFLAGTAAMRRRPQLVPVFVRAH